MMRCDQIERQLEVAFVEQRHDVLEKLRGHLVVCASCRAFYDDLYTVEAALGGAEVPAALSEAELQLLSAQVLPKPKEGARRSPRMIRWQLIGSLALALLVVGAALWGLQRPPHTTPSLQARGQDAALDDALAPVGLRLLCLESSGSGEVRARSLGDRPMPGTRRCRRADSLALTVRNETDKHWYLRVLLVSERGVTAVFPASGAAATVAPTGDELPLGESIALAAYPVGALKVVGVFTAARLDQDADELHRLVVQYAARDKNSVLSKLNAHVVQLAIEVAP